jgi:hypothetical protein
VQKSFSRYRRPWLSVISEEENHTSQERAAERGPTVIDSLLLTGHPETTNIASATEPLETNSMLVSDPDENPIKETVKHPVLLQAKSRGTHGSYSSDEESKQEKKNIHYIRYKSGTDANNNLIIQRDGQSLGDLNFKGPIQNISLNENKELEISFGKSPIKGLNGDTKLYDSQDEQKPEVFKVPLAGIDSDESIEVNIDIDWPRIQPQNKKETTQILSSNTQSDDEQPDLGNPDDTPPNSERQKHSYLPYANLAGLTNLTSPTSALWYAGGSDLTMLERSL